MDKGKWDPEKKSKCYYETGDEKAGESASYTRGR